MTIPIPATTMSLRTPSKPTSPPLLRALKKYYKFDEASQKFTNFPSLTYLYNTNDSHKAIG